MATRQPTIGSGRLKEGGRLATDKNDFNAHVEGASFRQGADTIDVSPAIANLSGTNVQTILQQLAAFITNSGSGFISIGQDGYTAGTYNVGSIATPTFLDTFNAAKADSRLADGGIILILAGTYVITSTITVPVGISIIGEVAGTTLIGNTSEQSMFLINYDSSSLYIGGSTGGSEIILNKNSNINKVKFSNLILIDNFDGTVNSGNPTMVTVPMILCKKSSNFTCENVSFIGRVQNNVPASGRTKTQNAIGYTLGGATSTSLIVKDCFFDGLKTGIQFTTDGGDSDYLSITDCKAYIYGTEYGGLLDASLNSFIVTTGCNALISNNYMLFMGTTTIAYFIYISTSISETPTFLINNNFGRAPADNVFIKNDSGFSFKFLSYNNNWSNITYNSIVLTGLTGKMSLVDSSSYGKTIVAGDYTTIAGIVSYVFINSSFDIITFQYIDDSIAVEMGWAIDLFSLLPPGVQITNVNFKYDLSPSPNVGNITLRLMNNTGTETTTTAIVGGSGFTIDITPGTEYFNYSENKCKLDLRAVINHNNVCVLTIYNFTVTFK